MMKNNNLQTIPAERRYDVDWIRTLAMALLIFFHVVLTFMPWAKDIGFPANKTLLEELAPVIAMLSIWRIPILFLVSGMGVRFAMERRDWKQLLTDRSVRILLPYIFGIVVLQYIVNLLMPYLGWDAEFFITFGHLWFLLNIYLYFVWLIGILIYLKDNPDNAFFRFLKNIMQWPLGIFLFAIPVILEAWLVDPLYFSMYVESLHGWLLGLICYFLGFIFISVKESFWPAVLKNRWYALTLAFSLYLVRLYVFELQNELGVLTALESFCWIIAVFGFAARHLNKASASLTYFSAAVYPVYIVHMPVQFIIAYYLLPLQLAAELKFLILLAGTFALSLFLYEFLLRRIKWIRPLFGIKLK